VSAQKHTERDKHARKDRGIHRNKHKCTEIYGNTVNSAICFNTAYSLHVYCRVVPCIPRNRLECTGIHGRTQEYMGVHWNTRPRGNTQEQAGIHGYTSTRQNGIPCTTVYSRALPFMPACSCVFLCISVNSREFL
jgi:hypothetical protein